MLVRHHVSEPYSKVLNTLIWLQFLIFCFLDILYMSRCFRYYFLPERSSYSMINHMIVIYISTKSCFIQILAISCYIISINCNLHFLYQGSSVRIDTTLLGFDNMTWQRGSRSYIFKVTGKIVVIYLELSNCCTTFILLI